MDKLGTNPIVPNLALALGRVAALLVSGKLEPGRCEARVGAT